MMSSRVQMTSESLATLFITSGSALLSHTSVPCVSPAMRTSSSIVCGCVFSSTVRTKSVPNSGMPSEPTEQPSSERSTPSGSGEVKMRHGLGVVERNLARVEPGDVLQHAQRGRVVVAEDVELDEPVVHGVEVEVRGDGVLVLLVRRVLDGRVVKDVVPLGHDDDAARVLPAW